MYLKILFATISYLTTFICIFGIIKFNPSKRTFVKTILLLTVLYSLPAVVDVALFLIMVTTLIPPGDYGTGIELIVAIINLIVFIPTYLLLGNKMHKKFKALYPERKDLRALKHLWEAAIIKIVFVIPAVIWIVEAG